MSKATKSARGVIVDFDLLKIKQQMAATPKTVPVTARENFIDQRFKRRLKKAPVVTDPPIVPAPVPVLDPALESTTNGK